MSLYLSLVAQTVKRLPTMQETQVQFLGWENALEKEMATHCSVLGKPHGQRSLSMYPVTEVTVHGVTKIWICCCCC